MNGLLGMGILGWIVAFVGGFIVGGLFFLSIKLQVEYVVKKQGPLWVMPAALYARLALIAILLVLIAKFVPGGKVAAVMLAATAGAVIARVLVSRIVRESAPEGNEANGEP